MIYPQITIVPLGPIDNGNSTVYNAAFYVSIYDAATGELTPGNGLSVTFQNIYNGIAGTPYTKNIIGSQQKINEGLYQEVNNATGNTMQSFDISILSYDNAVPDEPPPNPSVCDAVITAVTINQKESAPGATDAQVTIMAQSSQLPLSYSLDGETFQSSPVYTGLHGGVYTAYVSDAAGCTATRGFTVDMVQNLLVADPSVDMGGGNISRWNAAFNPIVFTYQRKDFEVTGISADGNGKMVVSVNADLAGVLNGDLIYLCAGALKGVYPVSSVSGGQLFIDSLYISSVNNNGYININRLRPYYQVNTEITYIDRDTQTTQTITSVNRPDQTGLVRADLSSFLQSLLRVKDESDYTEINFRDDNLASGYTIRYAEVWDGHDADYISVEKPYYVVYAAKQLGEAYGGNLAAYVPFPLVNNQTKLAKWVTDFAEPVLSISFPFDIAFVYIDELTGLNIYCEMTLLDINRQPITGSLQTSYLENQDNSLVLEEDNDRIILTNASTGRQAIAPKPGLNRLLIYQAFPPEAYYFTLVLKYDESGTARAITQTQTVRIDDMPDDQSVYLRWIGLTGSWNYYRFIYNQEVSLDVQNATIVKNYVTDWARQEGIEEVISKTAGQKMKVMAEDLSVADIKGLQSIKYSPKVQMLVNRNPIKWQTVVLNTATFAEYETRNGQAPFSVTFNIPGVNVQRQ